MSTSIQRPRPELSEYEKNRQHWTEEFVRPYDGQWVAVSLDGRRIIAGAADLIELDPLVRQAGEHINNVALEFIDLSGEIEIGGAETV